LNGSPAEAPNEPASRKRQQAAEAFDGEQVGGAERTRQLLLSAAQKEFAEAGIAGARIDRIARLAGVNKQAIYYHFGNKEDLFRILLEYGYEQTLRKNEEIDVRALPPVEAISAIVGQLFDRISSNREHMELILDENRHHGRHLKGKFHHVVDPLISKIAEVVSRGEVAGEFRSGLKPDELYLDMISMIMLYFTNIYTLSWLLGKDLSAEDALQQRKRHVIDFILMAIQSSR